MLISISNYFFFPANLSVKKVYRFKKRKTRLKLTWQEIETKLKFKKETEIPLIFMYLSDLYFL